MKQLVNGETSVLIAALFACTACGSVATVEVETGDSYGDGSTVLAVVGAVKSQGVRHYISSRAIRLPEQPMGEIAVFDYQFPANCGAHVFRVYETQDAQILEYDYAGRDGRSHVIRDYVASPSPFVRPGLWSAFDHTAGNISTMTSQVGQRGDRMFHGAYSQGLVTNLPESEQRALGTAYEQALGAITTCDGSQSVAIASSE